MPDESSNAGGLDPRADESTLTASPGTVQAQLTALPGDRFGRYKILEEIGQGGCGAVFVAEQEEPVRRRVALKVVKLGMDTRQVIARFEAERQALAMMDHPNIAKVLDAGATDTGRPFFVMELVRGIKITDYCDQNRLSTSDRLKLFIQVCQAVQHAHQKGIIHRDLKPSNILVTLQDGIPTPKVIDFGIAKATANQKLTDKTIYTAFEQFIGTPAYMSPEQAEMTGMDIDTRSDIYSLGVLLYELLVGETPFSPQELLGVGLDAMRRILREKDPARPSLKLSTMTQADLTAIALHRQSDPPRLIKLVRSDLDWIVLKCLEKDRTRRYETANGLAMDIQRHLTNEPVVARPPSRLYEFQKTVRRHKVGFAVTGAILAVLTFGLGISLWALNRESQARGRAVLAEIKATSEAAQRREEAQRLESLVGSMVSAMSVDVSDDSAIFTAVLKWTGESISGLTNEAAFKTNSDVQYMLGLMHHYGVRMPMDDAEARKWLLRSAEQHNIWAEWHLAVMYRSGRGVPRDSTNYAKWARKAAEDGHHGAQAALVRIYSRGEGVPRDEAEALKWLHVADKNDPLILNWLARDMVTSQDPKFRNGSNAVAYAEMAVALTHRNNAEYLDTLAAAYAEMGQFSNAVSTEKEAIKLQSQRRQFDEFAARLRLYEANVPYRYQPADTNALAGRNSSTNSPSPGAEPSHNAEQKKPLAGVSEAEAPWRQKLAIAKKYGKLDGHAYDDLSGLICVLEKEGKSAVVNEVFEEFGVQYPMAVFNCVGRRYATGDGIRKDLAAAALWYRKSAEQGDFNAGATAAWILATSIEPTTRDGRAAVILAETAADATHRKSAPHLDVLAAAYAEIGQFEKAASTEREAMTFLTAEVAKKIYGGRLKLYESKAPYHDPGGVVPNLWAREK